MKKTITLIAILFCQPLLASTDAAVPATPSTTGPCGSEEHRQFDFWLGQWTAYSKDGKQMLGTNHLRSMMGGCIMQENWQSGSGPYQGTSYNFYSSTTGKWHQTWIDNSGGHLFLEGEFKRGAMRLQGKRKDQEGNTALDRITWTPMEDGRVRQHWQMTIDGGKSWQVLFDGYYQKDRPEGSAE